MGIKKGTERRSCFCPVMPFFITSCAKRSAPILATILIIGLMLMLSPRYLLYSDAPQRSDVIILFPDPELDAMRREARQLIENGYSRYLCIPTSFSLYHIDQNEMSFTAVLNPAVTPGIGISLQSFEDDIINMDYFFKIRKECGFPPYFENTHVEMLLAKKIMNAYGFKSAIFVSSPYHMRRIKMIAASVFDSTYAIKLIPSRFEKSFGNHLPSLKDMGQVFTEYPKVVWFLCYDLWERCIGLPSWKIKVS
ncbi:MAG: ElyC/SanA/YdcF family protein [Smithellaceae bacterium]